MVIVARVRALQFLRGQKVDAHAMAMSGSGDIQSMGLCGFVDTVRLVDARRQDASMKGYAGDRDLAAGSRDAARKHIVRRGGINAVVWFAVG